jgi:1-acyl-sn-glycerol-3-phosphate acyltransferase
MNRRTAILRFTEAAARDALPLAGRLARRVRSSVEGLTSGLLGPDFAERMSQLRSRYQDGDPFGLDPDTAKYAAMGGALIHRLYFRTHCEGLENVPTGPVMLVANHSGQIPLDAVIIVCALFLDGNPPRVVRAAVDKWVFTLPFVSTFFSRVGEVVGVPENARRLLEMGEALLVFPEGIRGISKPFSRRYELEPFGLGFMRLAMETETPIVPVGVIGAEEQYINFGNVRWAARALGVPVFPLVPQFALTGALPLPTKFRIYFGEPLRFRGDPDEDDHSVDQKVWVVRQAVQNLLSHGLAKRAHIFF